jgi:phosphoribosylamine---glycine ligase
MKFFMISKCGEGAGLLKRIQEEGNECSIKILESGYSSVYDGILNKADRVANDSIIIFDSSGNGARVDRLKRNGYSVFGASSFADKLETDREFGLNFMNFHGINTPYTENFTDFNKGIEFIKSNKDLRFVFKPSGELPCKLTYSCSDSEDLILYMKFVENNFSKEIESFVLQQFIDGKIISSEFFVGPNGFVDGSYNHTIEVKKLMNDDLGPSTGCAGNIVWMSEEDEIASLLKGCEEALVKENYIGPIDLNCIVAKDGVYGLEWTPRFGLDAMPTWLQLVENEVGEIISDICQGLNPKINFSNKIAGGVRLTIPPYPIEPESVSQVQKVSPNKGIPIRGYEGFEENFYFYEVELKDDILVHSDGTGVIAVVSSIGETPEESLELPYQILEEMKIPDKQYRTDLDKVLPKMHEEVMEVLGETVRSE